METGWLKTPASDSELNKNPPHKAKAPSAFFYRIICVGQNYLCQPAYRRIQNELQ